MKVNRRSSQVLNREMFRLEQSKVSNAVLSLPGDNTLNLKVSTNGTSFANALSVDLSTGATTWYGSSTTFTGPIWLNFNAATGSPHIKLGTAGLLGIWGSSGDTFVFEYNSTTYGTLTSTGLTLQNNVGNSSLTIISSATAAITVRRDSNDTTAPSQSFQKARGTPTARLIVQNNDIVGSQNFNGYDGATNRVVGQITTRMFETTPSTTAMGGQMRIGLIPPGSITNTEIIRIDHTNGISMFGANPVIGPNRGFIHRLFTFATLPTASTVTGSHYHISDGAAAPVFGAAAAGGGTLRTPVYSDGTIYRNG